MPADASSYYYADGRKVRLRPNPKFIAIESGPASKQFSKEFRARRIPLSDLNGGDGVAILPQERVGDELRNLLTRNGLTRPVFSAGDDGMLVPLPEVRVQEGTGAATAESTKAASGEGTLAGWLERNADRVEVVRQAHGQAVLRPKSGKSEDALAIANEIYQAVRPAMSQPRFLRILNRPN